LAGRALASLAASPFVYDLVQRLAGAHKICGRIRPILDKTRDGVVLDVGAGTGNLERLLPGTAQYMWLDPDAQKLRGFRTKSTAPAVLGDATSIPLKDRSVDWVLCVGVSHHLDDGQFGQMLDELRRVARNSLFFLDGVLAPRLVSRILWRYDRGRHPRAAETLRQEIGERFDVVSEDEFTILHRYLLIVGR
jgi:SAM-dependent methyltransferase